MLRNSCNGVGTCMVQHVDGVAVSDVLMANVMDLILGSSNQGAFMVLQKLIKDPVAPTKIMVPKIANRLVGLMATLAYDDILDNHSSRENSAF